MLKNVLAVILATVAVIAWLPVAASLASGTFLEEGAAWRWWLVTVVITSVLLAGGVAFFISWSRTVGLACAIGVPVALYALVLSTIVIT